MFTGIVQELAEVVDLERLPDLLRLHLHLSAERRVGLTDGASLAVNGVCLTVARQDGRGAGCDVIQETLARTNLGELVVGDRVNIERAVTFVDEMGGHRVSGHVSGRVEILAIRSSEHSRVVRLSAPEDWSRFLFHKGFIALDGASLTISALDRSAGWFEVSLIPETLARTTFGFRQVGDLVNLEVDAETAAVVETVERLFANPQWREQFAQV